MSRRTTLSIALLLVLVLSIPAFAEVTVTVWKARHGEDEAIFGDIIKRFEEANPGIKVEHLVTPWTAWDEQYGAAFAGGNPPDIAYMPDEFYARFAAAGQLIAINELWPEDTATLQKAFPSGTWAKGTYNGKQYGIPTVGTPFLMFVNADLAKAAGVTQPDTWDEFMEAVIALGKVTEYGFVGTTRANDNAHNSWYNFLFQAGCDLINEDGTAVGWDNEGGVAALEFLTKLMQLDETPMAGTFSNDEIDELFLSGKGAIRIAGPDYAGLIERGAPDMNFDIWEPLVGPAGNRLIWSPVGAWVMAQGSQHKEEAWKFMKFLIDNEEHYATALDMLPGRLDAEAFPGKPKMQIYTQIGEFFYPTPIHPQLRLTHNIFNAEAEAAFLGLKTPEQAIKDAAKRINQLLAE